MRSLIIGGAGYIGTHLVEHLLDVGNMVTVVDSHVYGVEQLSRLLPDVEAHVGDAQNEAYMTRFFKAQAAFDEVYFLAADATMYAKRSYKDAAKLCFELAHQFGVKRVVFTSTSMVYGEGHQGPIAEDRLLYTRNFYGRDKLRCEKLMAGVAHVYNSPTALYIFRLFNVTGRSKRLAKARFNTDHLLDRLVNAHENDGSVVIHGNGECMRDYVHVGDVVKILGQRHFQHSSPDSEVPIQRVYTYNVGTGQGTTVLQAVQQVTAHFGKGVPTGHVEMREDDIRYLVADTTRLRNAGYHIPRPYTVAELMDLRQGRD